MVSIIIHHHFFCLYVFHKLCLFCPAPTAPPDSVMHLVVTPTSVTLTWIPPPSNETNGVIRQYVLFVIEEDTGRNFTLTSTVTELIVGNLHPFYTYHFAVSAFTVAAGPYTQQYTIQTEQDGKLQGCKSATIGVNFSISFISSSQCFSSEL